MPKKDGRTRQEIERSLGQVVLRAALLEVSGIYIARDDGLGGDPLETETTSVSDHAQEWVDAALGGD